MAKKKTKKELDAEAVEAKAIADKEQAEADTANDGADKAQDAADDAPDPMDGFTVMVRPDKMRQDGKAVLLKGGEVKVANALVQQSKLQGYLMPDEYAEAIEARRILAAAAKLD